VTEQKRLDRTEETSPHIGTLNEKPLHAALKTWYSEDGDRFEVPILGFVADIVRGTTLIEIQTGSTSGLQRKLATFLRRHEVRLVLPVAARKTIVNIGPDGKEQERRLSPRRAGVVDVFRQLVSLGGLLGDSNLSVDVVLVHEQETRHARPSRGRAKRYVVAERRLVEVMDCVSFRHPADFLGVIPATLAEGFTTADLAKAIRQPRWMAQKIAYVLRTMGVLQVIGKRGNAYLYERDARS
jgi:hypothetical protein